MEPEQYINIRQLAIGYHTGRCIKLVASNLNAEIRKGELVCLLGANGTGKSTLMRTICRFQPILGGTIEIMNQQCNNLNEKAISRLVSVVLTDRVAVPNATVEELVSYGRSPYTGLLGRLRQHDLEMVDTAMRQCGIAHKRNDLLSALSDGERQKAFIAKALAQDTPIIILDEPTAFLDLPARVEIIHLLREIASTSGKSVLLSTHDLDLALQMADRLWLLQHGGPLITGSPEDLLLENAFQSMFAKGGIEFDNRTGLFKVIHNEHTSIAFKGHGFGYVLLRRAFSRKGIKLDPQMNQQSWRIEIMPGDTIAFSLYFENQCITTNTSVEIFVKETLRLMNKGMNLHFAHSMPIDERG